MKLEKFYAESMPEAMSMIQKKLGVDAVIYSHEKKNHFIEVVAGAPKSSIPLQPVEPYQGMPKTSLDSRVLRIQKLQKESLDFELQEMEKRNLLQYKLRQLKFTHQFIDNFLNLYANNCDMQEIENNDQIIKLLLANIHVAEQEIIDKHSVCALIGPTGVGKSTTIAKLAKRFITKYGSENLGIISTDFQRIITKNQFYYFGKLLDVQVEYAKDLIDIQQALHALHDKKLILIDTAGVSQRDNQKIATLFDELYVEGEKVPLYLVLPCNLQSDILNDVVTTFNLPNTAGCIMTKMDECTYIAPCLSVIVNHALRIAYVCGGQNLSDDITPANSIEIINAVFRHVE